MPEAALFLILIESHPPPIAVPPRLRRRPLWGLGTMDRSFLGLRCGRPFTEALPIEVKGLLGTETASLQDLRGVGLEGEACGLEPPYGGGPAGPGQAHRSAACGRCSEACLAAEPSRCLRQKQARRSRGSRPNMQAGRVPRRIFGQRQPGAALQFSQGHSCGPQGKLAKRKRF